MPSGGGEKVPTPTAPAGATVGDAGRGAAAPAPIAPPSPAPQPETPIAPSPATAPAAPVDDGAGARALAAIADAAQRVAAAGETHQKALAAIADWTSQHAGALDALADLSVLEQAVTEAERLRIDPKLFPEPAKATPEQVRAYDTAMVGVLSAAPGGARVGERALTFLRGDLYGREVAGVTSWQGIHFYGPGFQRAASTMLAADKAVAAPVPPSLVEAEASARKGLAEAQASLDAARATPASKDAPAPTVPTATDPK